MGAFWEPKGLQKSSEILDAILEVKKEAPPIFLGRPGGMRGGPGEDNGGVREPISAENRGRGSKAGARSSSIASSTPSPVGRRSAPRIPPGRVHFEAVPFDSWVTCVDGVTAMRLRRRRRRPRRRCVVVDLPQESSPGLPQESSPGIN